jgi:mono/diheme cytochrome c family protein
LRITAPVISVSTVLFVLLCWAPFYAQQSTFRNAPPATASMKNPYSHSPAAATAGKAIYAKTCAQCHGKNREGMGPAPPLDSANVRTANPGELFWFITKGNPSSGMPAWPNLSKQERWQVVTFVQSPAK